MKARRKIKQAQSGQSVSKTDSLVAARKKEVQQARAKLDSITKVKREEIIRKKDSVSQRVAASKGMTVAEVRAEQAKNKNKKDVGIQTCGPSFKATKCGINKAATKQAKKDWKKK
jgi:hypothetical protein